MGMEGRLRAVERRVTAIEKTLTGHTLAEPEKDDEVSNDWQCPSLGHCQGHYIAKLEAVLHARFAHPDFEYEVTHGPRWDMHPPEGEGWELNTDFEDNGWCRFDYHEEAYWRRRKPEEETTDAG